MSELSEVESWIERISREVGEGFQMDDRGVDWGGWLGVLKTPLLVRGERWER
jgi:hypothetical protein